MVLVMDIGNTNIVVGLYENDKLTKSFRLNTDISKTSDEYASVFLDIMKTKEINIKEVEGILIASVVPNINVIIEEMIERYMHINYKFVSPGIKTNMQIKIDNPKQLGADLLVGAVGAFEKYGGPCIVIDMGTATTFSYVNKDKQFLGGIIVPGIKTSLKALTENAANLSSINLEAPKQIVGKDTITAIQSGMIYGTAAMIDGMIKKLKRDHNEDDAKVVITGGLASKILPHCDEEMIYDENLLLDGLKIIYDKNM